MNCIRKDFEGQRRVQRRRCRSSTLISDPVGQARDTATSARDMLSGQPLRDPSRDSVLTRISAPALTSFSPIELLPVLPSPATRTAYGLSQRQHRSNHFHLLCCMGDISKMAEGDNEKISAGLIRTTIETNVGKMDDHAQWRRAVTVDPRNTNRIRIACGDKAEHQLVKQVAEAKIGAGARVLRDELYPVKIHSVKWAAVRDEKYNILTGAAVAPGEGNETTIMSDRAVSTLNAA